MGTPINRRFVKTLVAVVISSFTCSQTIGMVPADVLAGASDDLKNIEYRYYFRGDYPKAIEELRAFLARTDISDVEWREAKEFLAASLVLSGSSSEAKSHYLDLLKNEATYGGPDPAVFKSDVIAVFEEVRADYASAVIRSVPDSITPDGEAGAAQDVATISKPIYKKWWFYAAVGAVVLALAGAAAGGDDGGGGVTRDTGAVTVVVEVP